MPEFKPVFSFLKTGLNYLSFALHGRCRFRNNDTIFFLSNYDIVFKCLSGKQSFFEIKQSESPRNC